MPAVKLGPSFVFCEAILYFAKKTRFDFSVKGEKSQLGVTVKEGKPQLGASAEGQKPELGVLMEEENPGFGVSVKEEFACRRPFKPEKMNGLREETDQKRSKSGNCLDLGSLSLKPQNIARVLLGRIMVVLFQGF